MAWNRRQRRSRRRAATPPVVDYTGFDLPKGPNPREIRDGRQKKERSVKDRIRRVVFNRDPGCVVPEDPRWPHSGPHEWAHLEEGTRARTRGKPPEERHTPRLSCRLCQEHHRMYDASQLDLEFLTDDGADGDMAWRVEGELVGSGREDA